MPKASKSNSGTATLTAPAPAHNITPAVATPSQPEIKANAKGNAAPKAATKPAQAVSEKSPVKEEHQITLKFHAPHAHEVKVAGNFNEWRPQATPLRNNGAGEWIVHLTLRSGRYEYRFVVDGHWVEDPQATQRGANPYGGFNSVLNVPQAARSSV